MTTAYCWLPIRLYLPLSTTKFQPATRAVLAWVFWPPNAMWRRCAADHVSESLRYQPIQSVAPCLRFHIHLHNRIAPTGPVFSTLVVAPGLHVISCGHRFRCRNSLDTLMPQSLWLGYLDRGAHAGSRGHVNQGIERKQVYLPAREV